MFKTFTDLCNALIQEQRFHEEGIRDFKEFSVPSDLFPIVVESYHERIRNILRMSGFTPLEFFKELEERTNERFAHWHFGWVMFAMTQEEEERDYQHTMALLSENDMNELI